MPSLAHNIGQASPMVKLFPPIEPFRSFFLDVGDGHSLYVEQCGNVAGLPAIVFHGGPGAGCSPYMRRFFDPAKYHIILFDQRGAGKSRPSGHLGANTTWDLVDDVEKIRKYLGIERWLLFGGSWGSTLALLYAQLHPDRARALILRGLFTMTEDELRWFYGGGAGRFFPEAWQEFKAAIPPSEQENLIAAYYRRLTAQDPAEQLHFAKPWVRWETMTAALRPYRGPISPDGRHARAFARIESHFFHHHGWLTPETQILANMSRIADTPGIIVQGRYDMICPPDTAYALDRAWPAGHLIMIDDAGHALSEPGISATLLAATSRFIEN